MNRSLKDIVACPCTCLPGSPLHPMEVYSCYPGKDWPGLFGSYQIALQWPHSEPGYRILQKSGWYPDKFQPVSPVYPREGYRHRLSRLLPRCFVTEELKCSGLQPGSDYHIHGRSEWCHDIYQYCLPTVPRADYMFVRCRWKHWYCLITQPGPDELAAYHIWNNPEIVYRLHRCRGC